MPRLVSDHEPQAHMTYYSHVLYFPDSRPFDRPDSRWTSFVGEFVAPLMRNRPELYWCSYYGDHARFRVLTDDYSSLQPTLESLRDVLGLIDKGEEKDLSLVGDLGHERFRAHSSTSTPERRAELVLRYLNSASLLLVDNLQRTEDGYWRLEQSAHRENPLGNNFETIAHLLANMTQFQFDVHFGHLTAWMPPSVLMSFRCNL